MVIYLGIFPTAEPHLEQLVDLFEVIKLDWRKRPTEPNGIKRKIEEILLIPYGNKGFILELGISQVAH